MYIVIREGVYRQEIVGMSVKLPWCEKLALKTIKAEPDDYHDIVIHRGNVGKEMEDVTYVKLYRRKGNNITVRE